MIANLLSVFLSDSSVFSTQQTMTVSRLKSDKTALDWSLCEKCDVVVPPRSWHCENCGICILKRDHHCMFASNCIGYRNHRFFYQFLIYFFIGTTYAFIYNSYFIWFLNGRIYLNLLTIYKMILPMFMVFYGTAKELHLFIYMLIAVGSLLSGVLLIFHWRLISTNSTTHEKAKGIYDQGLARNLHIIFGDRWLASILWPFTETNLPEIFWDPAESSKSK